MVEEKPPAKKVVKRVVKKTVVRPPATSGPAAAADGAPRPAAKATVPSRRTSVRLPRRSTTLPADEPAAEKVRVTVGADARQDVPADAEPKTPRVSVGTGLSSARGAVGDRLSSGRDRVADGALAVRDKLADGFDVVRDWRLPHVHPMLAAVLSGLVAGLVAVALGMLAVEVFDRLRGVPSGGGTWGTLTFVVVAFVAFLLGERLLAGFGSSQSRLTSFLGVVLAIVLMLGLLLGLVDSRWALLVVPLLGAASYAAAQALLDLADNAGAAEE